MIYRRLSIAARLIGIAGIVGVMFLYGLILLDGEGESRFLRWLLMITVFIAGPLEILGLILSFFRKSGYKFSLIFSIPLLAVAIWIVFATAKGLLFEARGFDILQSVISVGFVLLIFSPLVLIFASYILDSSQNKKLERVATVSIISAFMYVFLAALLFLMNTITLVDE